MRTLLLLLCAASANASELGRLELMADDHSLIAPGFTGERAAGRGLVMAGDPHRRPTLALSDAPSRRIAASGLPSPAAPKKAGKGPSFGRKLLILGAAIAVFAAGGLVIGAVVASIGYAFGAAWALQALGTGAGIGAGLGFSIGFPAAFQEQASPD